MEILLRQARIIDPSSPFHLQTKDILISNGSIKEIGSIQSPSAHIIEIEDLSVSPGWTDVFAHFCDPGFEFRETLETGATGAAKGGFTDVMVIPNTAPVIHNKSGVEYIVQRSKTLPVHIHPIGAVTKNNEGKELAEMYDMHASGAVAFGDGLATIQSAGLLLKALQYLKAIDKPLIQVPDDLSISATGLMNEGILSTRLGLPGKPDIAEELMVRRDIELAKYTGSKIHITGISTAQSVAMVRQAKKEGLNVTASVTPYHLYFSDENLKEYDTNLKVNPPLRTIHDRDALRAGVMDGTIDCLATHHLPHDSDHKVVEFEYANYGMTGLETAFAALLSSIPGIDPARLILFLSLNPRKIFGLPAATIHINQPASLSLFNMTLNWTVGASVSKSDNTPFTGMELTGKPLGIINKDQLFLND
ncbi:MAG: dihydroorotase [Flavisolibacter sp.]|nr:dihydroorotase [Flavisolibacter sp.]